MTGTISHNGYLPTAIGLMATSPELLDGFLKMSAAFDGTTLDPVAREVVIITMATRNGSGLFVAMHTARLTKLAAEQRADRGAAERVGAGGRSGSTRSGCSPCGCSTRPGMRAMTR